MLLDRELGGSWSISPTATRRIERRYIDRTNVLTTQFHTATGVALLTDFMPAASEKEKRARIWPEHELVRRVKCEEGEVDLQSYFNSRPDYGRARTALCDRGKLGLRIELGPVLLTLQSDVGMVILPQGGASATVKLSAGESIDFSLSYSTEGPAVLPPLGELISDKLALTVDWWQRWADQTTYKGEFQDQAVRSALALKLMSYAPSGAVVAAPTTSLPERLGGDLNWDYRYCWLRDAALTARALFGLGFDDEACAFVSWTLHATRLTRPKLQVLYDVYGRSRGQETELSHFRGYADSRPVRVGNHAGVQFQLDVYGEVVEAVAHFVRSGRELDRETQRMLRHFGEYVCSNWHKPESGIWESRGPGQHYTHSRLMCWVALDRLIELHRQGRIHRIPVERFLQSRDQIRADIEARGWNADLHSYTQVLGGNTLDASVLLMPAHGYNDASSERMQLAHARIRERLSPAPGLLYRKEQSLTMREGAFGICGFWDVDFLARGGGTLEHSRRAFTQAIAYANDLGLFAEEIDPESGEALGNFPQAFTHVELINAALSLAEREEREWSNHSHAQWPRAPEREREHILPERRV